MGTNTINHRNHQWGRELTTRPSYFVNNILLWTKEAARVVHALDTVGAEHREPGFEAPN